MQHCPQCHSTALRRTRTRSLLERVRRSLTADRPHRCHDCGWRGWGPGRDPHHPDASAAILAPRPPDFGAIDAELEAASRGQARIQAAIGGVEVHER
jgi:hypothetical protein